MAEATSWDVVVVGAGAAGSVVAARLAASPQRTVLLVEAGPDLRANTPVGLRGGWGLNRDFYWSVDSEPDEIGEVVKVPRCRIVGGTSWMTRFAVRGSPADFDEWVGLGNPGWGFEDVLPDFKRLETDVDFGARSWHGAKGPIPVNRYLDNERTEVHDAAVTALEALGILAVDDHNQPGAVGVGRMPMNASNGTRVTVADAYLPLAQTPANLTIKPDTLVARVLFEGLHARGVELADGSVIEAGWVVISAGVLGSPVTLMRSGVGPADQLRASGIEPVVDLVGVGERLGDHPGTDLDCGYEGSGRSAPVLHSIATFHSQTTSSTAPPDLMLWISDPTETPGEAPSFVIDVVLLKPECRGWVRLRTANPLDPPRVQLPDGRNSRDLARLMEGYRLALEVANSAQMRRFLQAGPVHRQTDEELRRAIRGNSYSVPHYVGTCSMGPDPEIDAVVDTAGKVHGTDGLSVIDASIIPIVPSGFTHLPTIMVAEGLARQLASTL